MPRIPGNGVDLRYESTGEGPPLVLVHGSWSDHAGWDLLLPHLSDLRVVTYDRRGHSDSTAPPGQGSVREDVEDLLALVETLGIAPANVLGNSFGATIALRGVLARPAAFRSVILHEPPLFGLLPHTPEGKALAEASRIALAPVRADLEAGDAGAGARRFVEEVALGPGSWDRLPPARREVFVRNAFTWLDEVREIGAFSLPVDDLKGIRTPVLLTRGDKSFPWFPSIVGALASAIPGAKVRVLEGAGHVPQLTHPGPYSEGVREFLRGAGSRRVKG